MNNDRIEANLTELDAMIAARASDMYFGAWADWLAGLTRLIDLDGGYDPTNDLDGNRLAMAHMTDGLLHIAGQANGSTAERIRVAADRQAKLLRRRHAADAEVNPEATIPSAATVRMLALADICDEWLAMKQTSGMSNVDIVVTITADDLAEALEHCGTDACGASFRRAVLTAEGVPLDLGQRVRYFTDEQRIMAALRDGGCVFPACDARVEDCDFHHIEHFHADGPTDIANAAHLCKHHHRAVTHRRGWQMWAEADGGGVPTGRFRWRTPAGRELRSQQHGRRG